MVDDEHTINLHFTTLLLSLTKALSCDFPGLVALRFGRN